MDGRMARCILVDTDRCAEELQSQEFLFLCFIYLFIYFILFLAECFLFVVVGRRAAEFAHGMDVEGSPLGNRRDGRPPSSGASAAAAAGAPGPGDRGAAEEAQQALADAAVAAVVAEAEAMPDGQRVASFVRQMTVGCGD